MLKKQGRQRLAEPGERNSRFHLEFRREQLANEGVRAQRVDYDATRARFHSKALWEPFAVQLHLWTKSFGVEGQPC